MYNLKITTLGIITDIIRRGNTYLTSGEPKAYWLNYSIKRRKMEVVRKINFEKIKKTISNTRLATYQNLNFPTDKFLLGKYIWNVKLSENFYFLLLNLEVALRNSIYNAYLLHYPKKNFFYLYEKDLRQRHQQRKELHSKGCWKMLCGVYFNLSKEEIVVSDGRLISELNFGFWTKFMFDNHYNIIWRTIFMDVFPHIETPQSIDKSKRNLAYKIDKIRKFRNRIFHYEPIFNQNNLDEMHQDIMDILGWIDIDLQKLTILFDEYHKIKNEETNIVEKLSNFGEKNEPSKQTI